MIQVMGMTFALLLHPGFRLKLKRFKNTDPWDNNNLHPGNQPIFHSLTFHISKVKNCQFLSIRCGNQGILCKKRFGRALLIHINKKMTYSLMTGLLMAIIAVAWVVSDRRPNPDTAGKTEKSININASMFLENVHQTALKNGIQEWALSATSATFFEAEKKTIINDPVVTFFTEQSDNVHLTAKEGAYNTDTNKIEVSGNVTIQNAFYELATEKLHYEPDTRTIQSDTPVTISSKTFRFQADKMIIDLNTDKAELIGNVKGSLRGKLVL